MQTVIDFVLVALVILAVALLAAVIYSGINEGLGEDGLSKNHGIVEYKIIDEVDSTMLIGKVMVLTTTTTTYHYVTVTLNGRKIKMDVAEEQYKSVKIGDTVYVGYTVGYFDKEKHYNSVFKAEVYK